MSTANVQNALDAAQRLYRNKVRHSWVFDTLYTRNLADILKPAQVGWAPGGWTTTTDALANAGYSHKTLISAGISRRTDDGQVVDVLHNRMTFPIRDVDGQIAGFTGRAAPDATDSVPKWLNTPATERFHKRELLYGLEDLKPGSWPVFVEGTLDRWAIIKATKDTAMPLTPLAPCGTSLTPEHLELVRAVTDRPFVLSLDGDGPGQTATVKTWETLIRDTYPGELHRAIILPAGADPADLVGSHHTAQLVDALRHPQLLASRVAGIRAEQAALDPEHTIQRLSAAQHTIRGDVAAVPPTELVGWMKQVAHAYDLDFQTVHLATVDAISPEPDPADTWRTQRAPALTQPATTKPPALQRTAATPGRAGLGR